MSFFSRRQIVRAILPAFAAVLGGCATQSYAPESAPELSVIRDYAPFYTLGPMQGRGPDATLRVGQRVKLLRKEMGYSYVQLEDERAGYIPNEDLVPAPPRPKPTPAPAVGGTASGWRRSGGGERFRGEQVNDSPLPEVPSLDLNIGPEDVAPPPPPPTLDPGGEPTFRL